MPIQGKYRVALVDDFVPKTVYGHPVFDLNGDGEPDISHGEVVQKFLESTLEKRGVKLNRLEISRFQANPGEIGEAFECVLKSHQEAPFDAINVSMAFYFRAFEDRAQQEASILLFNKDNNTQSFFPEAIKSKFNSTGKTLMIRNANQEEVFKSIQALSQIKTPVFTASGNHSSENNLLSLLENTVTVGALDETGKPASWASDNQWVQQKYPAEFKITPLKDDSLKQQGEAALDFTGDNEADIFLPINQPEASKQDFKGTSFSTPQATANYLADLIEQGNKK